MDCHLPPAVQAGGGSRNLKCGIAAAILLGITWLPLFGMHAYKAALSAPASGTVVALFSPAVSQAQLSEMVVAADGALVRPVLGAANLWLIHSPSPDFVAQLKRRGAWAVFSIELLQPGAIFDCFSSLRSV